MEDNLIKSKFNFLPLLVLLCALGLLKVSINIVIDNWPLDFKEIGFGRIPFILLIAFTLFWLVYGELRKRIVFITISNSLIEIQNIFGMKKTINFKDLKGYYNCKTWLGTQWKGRHTKYIYLVTEDNTVLTINNQYYRNFLEIQKAISSKTPRLGTMRFYLLHEFRLLFSKF